MEQKTANKLVDKLTENMDFIKEVIKENLGLDVEFKQPEIRGRYDLSVVLDEAGNASTEHLTQSRLLAQMFKESEINIRCWMTDDERYASCLVSISYQHAYNGGSNGLNLMAFEIDLTEWQVTEIRK